MDKVLFRKVLRKELRSLAPEQRSLMSLSACSGLTGTPWFEQAGAVMMFLSLPDEVDTEPAIRASWSQGKTVVVPKIDWGSRSMWAVEIESLDHGLDLDARGLRVPQSDVAFDLCRIDLVVVPGLGFDRLGHRLGRGAGFYDRFLVTLRPEAILCGLCFEGQLVDQIPVEAHDRSVDWVVTDRSVIDARMQKGA